MAITDYFRKIESRSSADVRKMIESKKPDGYSLVDVRQPEEYHRDHLPGAKLIPLPDLPDCLGELEPDKTTILYCAAGIRSRAAASILVRAGFSNAYSMEGGMRSWNGAEAETLPCAGVTWLLSTRNADEVIGLARLLEEGMRLFYLERAAKLGSYEGRHLFWELAGAEQYHEDALVKFYRQRTGRDTRGDFSPDFVCPASEEMCLEGGVPLGDALSWARERSFVEILEFTMFLEVSSYERYLALRDRFADEGAREVFGLLAAEERTHLKRLSKVLGTQPAY